jgi:hypothetical protein
LERYVDPETPQGLEALRSLAEPLKNPRRVIIEPDEAALSVGRHAFHAAPLPDVLNVDEVAASGELPGREIAGQWRFLQQAVLDWLARAARPSPD